VQASFQLVVNCIMASLECIFQGAEKNVGVCEIGTRESAGEKLEGADCCMSSDG
jgi:hypothetical protein